MIIRVKIFSIMMFWIVTAAAQNSTLKPLENVIYNKDYSKMAAMNPEFRLQAISDYTRENILTSNMILHLATLLPNEQSKMNYLKSSYAYVFDPQNYAITTRTLSKENNKQVILKMMQQEVLTANASPGFIDFEKETKQITAAAPCPSSHEKTNNNDDNWVGNDDDNYNNTYPYNRYRPMDRQAFEAATKRLKAIGYDKDRLTTAKYITGSNWLSSKQVFEIIKLFPFDKSKLEYAKYAYSHTYDKGNFFIVNDLLTMRSSKLELMKYVENYNKHN